jgi:hypothetical protein
MKTERGLGKGKERVAEGMNMIKVHYIYVCMEMSL